MANESHGIYRASQLTTGSWEKAKLFVERDPEHYDAGIHDQYDNQWSFNIPGSFPLEYVGELIDHGPRHTRLAALHSVLADPKEFQRLSENTQRKGGSLGSRLKKLGSFVSSPGTQLWVAERQYATPATMSQRIPLLKLVGIRTSDRFGRSIAPVVQVRAAQQTNMETFAIDEPVVLFHGHSPKDT